MAWPCIMYIHAWCRPAGVVTSGVQLLLLRGIDLQLLRAAVVGWAP
jgi:hypothetical protein